MKIKTKFKIKRNTVLKLITYLALIINMIFSVCAIWMDDFNPGYLYIIWAISQLWLVMFTISNIDLFV